eukprot:1107783-Rhodomonas_salina.1
MRRRGRRRRRKGTGQRRRRRRRRGDLVVEVGGGGARAALAPRLGLPPDALVPCSSPPALVISTAEPRMMERLCGRGREAA